MADVDASEVMDLARDMARGPGRMERDAKRVMKKSALEIKRKMVSEFSGHSYAGHVPGSLEFQALGALSYEIGELDSAGPQWGIAAILAYGTSNNAPVVDHTTPLRRETPVMEHYLAEAAGDDVLGVRG